MEQDVKNNLFRSNKTLEEVKDEMSRLSNQLKDELYENLISD